MAKVAPGRYVIKEKELPSQYVDTPPPQPSRIEIAAVKSGEIRTR